MNESRSWIAPLTGVLFVVLFVGITLLFGEGKDATKDSADEIISYYKDHDTENTIGALLVGLASISLLFFTGYLRKVLRDAEGPGGWVSSVTMAGAAVFAGAASIAAAFRFELADYADDTDVIDPVVIQTINALDWDNFLFFGVGLGTLVLAGSISALKSGALPKWLGWFGVVVFIGFLTPAWPVGFIGAPLWILIVSIMLASRARSGGSTPAPVAS